MVNGIERPLDLLNNSKNKEVLAYLTEFYGKPNKENVAEWLKAEFGI